MKDKKRRRAILCHPSSFLFILPHFRHAPCISLLSTPDDLNRRASWPFAGGKDIKENAMLTTLAAGALVAQAVPNLLWLAIVFFIIALVAYVLGARGVAGMSAGIGRTLLFVFIILAVIVAIVSLMNGGTAV
jgi:uncharacterized membrane protein YtjA (UPF0391 family)